MKFKYLKIDLSSNTTYNCHAAKPHRIDFSWLEKYPGNLFNTDVNVSERRMMLQNERNASCEQNCWAAEDRGATSPRLYQEGQTVTHTDPVTTPEMIDLTVNIDCNLTCTYCCKEYSTSWQRDLIKNGDYQLYDFSEPRFCATTQDRVLNKLSQPELHNLKKYKTLLSELQSYRSTLKTIDVTGGEPLLDNQLVDVLGSLDLKKDCEIIIYTGLGVEFSRLKKMLEKLKHIANLQFKVSAECVGSFLEFNRYGNQWSEFQQKIDLLNQSGANWSFNSTVSNLTVFGFLDFVKFFHDKKIHLTFAYQPRFMSPFVLDSDSKQYITNNMDHINLDFQEKIIKSIGGIPEEKDRLNLRAFLLEFVKRRSDLDLKIYPKNFLQWLELDRYVV